MKLPKTIRVACYDYAVEKMDKHTAIEDRKYGSCSSIKHIISIDTEIDDMRVVNTLIHEVGHAIYDAYEIQEGDHEERIISTMATGWTQVFRDSPELLEFIREGLA